jgi:acyl carrier protein
MSGDLKEKLRAIVIEVTEIDDIPDETPFKDLGIDSMMAIEIVAEVERTYKLSIPEEELQDLTNFSRVYEKVKTKLGAAEA